MQNSRKKNKVDHTYINNQNTIKSIKICYQTHIDVNGLDVLAIETPLNHSLDGKWFFDLHITIVIYLKFKFNMTYSNFIVKTCT